jgi:hypothetical protein
MLSSSDRDPFLAPACYQMIVSGPSLIQHMAIETSRLSFSHRSIKIEKGKKRSEQMVDLLLPLSRNSS